MLAAWLVYGCIYNPWNHKTIMSGSQKNEKACFWVVYGCIWTHRSRHNRMLAFAVNFFFFQYDQVVACQWNQQTTPPPTTTKMQITAAWISSSSSKEGNNNARKANNKSDNNDKHLATNDNYTKNNTTRHPWECNCYCGWFVKALIQHMYALWLQ